jgi:hypothetical protein
MSSKGFGRSTMGAVQGRNTICRCSEIVALTMFSVSDEQRFSLHRPVRTFLHHAASVMLSFLCDVIYGRQWDRIILISAFKAGLL